MRSKCKEQCAIVVVMNTCAFLAITYGQDFCLSR